MRLIDADKLHPDRMTNKGNVAISQSQIAKAKTVDAVPMSVIDEIEKALIENVDRIENDDLRIAVAVFTSKALDDIREIVKEYET